MQALAQLPNLQNLTLKGCPLAEQPGYPESIRELLPQLQILDSHRISLPGKAGRQPGKAANSAADVSLPAKSSKIPPASSSAAVDTGRSAAVRDGAKPKPAQSIKPHDSSDRKMAGSTLRKQAPKRKHDEPAIAAAERAAVGQALTSRQPSKKQKKAGSAASRAPEATPSAQADARAQPTALTGKAKAKGKQAAEASLPASLASVGKPNTKLGSVEDKLRLKPFTGPNARNSAGAEVSGREVAGRKAKPVAGSLGSKQQKAAAIAPKQKSGKQGASKAKQPANGSNALAIGKEVRHSSSLTMR